MQQAHTHAHFSRWSNKSPGSLERPASEETLLPHHRQRSLSGYQRTRPSLSWWDCGAHGHTRTAQGPTGGWGASCSVGEGCAGCSGGIGLPGLVVEHVLSIETSCWVVVCCADCDLFSVLRTQVTGGSVDVFEGVVRGV